MDSSPLLFQLRPVCCSQDQRLPCCHQDACNFLSLRRSEPEETIARALCGSGKTPGTSQAVSWTTASFREERKRASMRGTLGTVTWSSSNVAATPEVLPGTSSPSVKTPSQMSPFKARTTYSPSGSSSLSFSSSHFPSPSPPFGPILGFRDQESPGDSWSTMWKHRLVTCSHPFPARRSRLSPEPASDKELSWRAVTHLGPTPSPGVALLWQEPESLARSGKEMRSDPDVLCFLSSHIIALQEIVQCPEMSPSFPTVILPFTCPAHTTA